MLRILALLLLLTVLLISIVQKERYEDFIKENKRDLMMPVIAPFSLWFIDISRMYNLIPKVIANVHQKAIILRGSRNAQKYTRAHMAKVVTVASIAIIITLTLGHGEEGIRVKEMMFGVFFTVILTVFQTKALDSKVKKRRESILIELPEFVNKVILLVNAGDTVQGAFSKCLKNNQSKIYDSPWYYELNEAMNKLSANASFQDSMKELNQRCSMQEVSVFTTTIMMNYRRGGTQLVDSLKELSTNLWDKRKTVTRIKGEEASSKLVFPMMIIFCSIMLVIIYPAIAGFMFDM